MDIDYFKQFNDQYGHAVGDEVLLSVTQLINENIRDRDLFARLGGEEFALLVARQNKKGVLSLAERLCTAIREYSLVYGDTQLTLTISIGVAHRESNESVDDLLKQADKSLYQAKSDGRDRVCQYPID